MNFDGRGEKTTELRAGKNGMRALIKKKMLDVKKKRKESCLNYLVGKLIIRVTVKGHQQRFSRSGQ